MSSTKRTVLCLCTKQGCWRGEDLGIPEYCQANDFLIDLRNSTKEYTEPESLALYKAASMVGQHNGGMTPRIKEALLLCQELQLSKIGFGACTAMEWEFGYIKKLFAEAGFKVFAASCQIGRVSAEYRGVPEVNECIRSACNPIGQAKVLNSIGTELNFILGLCMGHDILFTKYSEAPVSTLIVKDRVTGNNPAAALYGYHRRKDLFGQVIHDDQVI